MVELSIVTTTYCSEKDLKEFHARTVRAALAITNNFELIYVNDGCPQRSLQIALEFMRVDPRIVVVDLSRNFGHHRALMTGLQHAVGRHVFMIDSDLEEQPELLHDYWTALAATPNADSIYGTQETRKGGLFERVSGHIWYRFFALLSSIKYPPNGVTARLMTRRYVDALLQFPETELELWGVFVLVGFEQKEVLVVKGAKSTSTYSLRKKISSAVESITSFSSAPLTGLFLLGSSITTGSLLIVIYLIVSKFLFNSIIAGWTSILVSIWLLGGLIIFSIGLIGIYLSKMFLEIKRRPLAIIRKVYRSDDG